MHYILIALTLLIAVGCGGNDDDNFDESRYDELVAEIAARYTNDLGNPATESHVRNLVEQVVDSTNHEPIDLLEVMRDAPSDVVSVRDALLRAMVFLGPAD